MNSIEYYEEIVIVLSDILEKENTLLLDSKFKESKKLLGSKIKAITAYRGAVAKLIKKPELFQELEPNDRLYIKEISNDLDSLLKENDLILKTRMETSQSIMDSIITIMKKTTASNSTSYGSAGTFSPLEKSKNAMAINQTL